MSTNEELGRLWKEAIDEYLDSTNRSKAEQAVLTELKTVEQLEQKLEHDHEKFITFREKHVTIIRGVQNVTRWLTILEYPERFVLISSHNE